MIRLYQKLVITEFNEIPINVHNLVIAIIKSLISLRIGFLIDSLVDSAMSLLSNQSTLNNDGLYNL